MAINFPLIAPATPNSRTAKPGAVNQTGLAQSPFTGQQQSQEWDGEFWTWQIGLKPIKDRATAEAWICMLLALRGKSGTFLMGPGWARNPLGVGSGTPQVLGAGQSGKSLITRGWTPNTAGILKAGDYLQLAKNYIFAPIAFDDPSWVKTNGAVTPNTIVAPDGTTTADKFVGSAGNGTLVQTLNPLPPVIASRAFHFGVWLKAPGGAITCPIKSNDGVSIAAQTFNLTTSWQLFIFLRPLTSPLATTLTMQIGGDSAIGVGVEVDMWGAFCSSPTLDAHLHKNLTDAASDASGNATLDLFPRLRETTTDFARIYTASPAGVWRLLNNQREWTVDQALLYGIDIQAMEAL